MLYLARKLTDNQEILKTIWYSPVQPYFDYCDVVLGDCSKTRERTNSALDLPGV